MNPQPSLDLTGRNALVCGASQGIGQAVAITLAALGAQVTVLARNEDKLKQTLAELSTEHGQNHAHQVADLGDNEALHAQIQELLAKRGEFQILVNNAGGPPPGQAIEAKVEDYVSAFAQHLLANQTLTKALVPGMKNYGRIINIISTSIRQPIVGLGVSNTVRGAVASWAKTIATELGPQGITVNNVLPGFTLTERLDSIMQARAKKTNISVEQAWAQAKKEVPLNRFAEPEEVAYAVAFLASPAAAYVSGTNVVVDGGRTSCL